MAFTVLRTGTTIFFVVWFALTVATDLGFFACAFALIADGACTTSAVFIACDTVFAVARFTFAVATDVGFPCADAFTGFIVFAGTLIATVAVLVAEAVFEFFFRQGGRFLGGDIDLMYHSPRHRRACFGLDRSAHTRVQRYRRRKDHTFRLRVGFLGLGRRLCVR